MYFQLNSAFLSMHSGILVSFTCAVGIDVRNSLLFCPEIYPK